jgi:hypothetical protein
MSRRRDYTEGVGLNAVPARRTTMAGTTIIGVAVWVVVSYLWSRKR